MNTIDTNLHGPKYRIAFLVVVHTPGMGFRNHFSMFWTFFFKTIWSRIPMKKSETSEPKIKRFSGLLSNKGPT